MQATLKGSSSPTEARRKRKILVTDGASSDVSSQSRGASPRRVSYPSDDPSVRPAKRARKPLPRRSVGSAEPLWAYSEEADDPPPSFRGRGIKAEDNY